MACGRWRLAVVTGAALLALGACGGGDGGGTDVAAADVADGVEDVAVDAPAEDATGPDEGPAGDASPDAADDALDDADAADADDVPVGPVRAWRHRAIGGMSMGAMAISIAAQHPGLFDVVGALGGYADTTYLVNSMTRLQLGGFCPLEQLLGRDDALDDWDASPPVACGPGEVLFPLEFPQSFNDLHYDTNGLTMDREFYGEIFQNFTTAYGSLTVVPSEATPFLPAGVDFEAWRTTSGKARCADPTPVPFERALSAEHNPDGLYPVIPVCDSRKQVTPGLAPAQFDPAVTHDFPMDVLLAVDLNGNGERDLGEPVLMNIFERYEDVGVDGCPNAREDGAGGCLAPGAPDATAADPNGDDYDWELGVDGTERNGEHDDGEPFSDLGLDGVDAAVSGVLDEGEGNGVWDAVPAYQRVLANDADRLLRALPAEEVDAIDFWWDAGMRDALHAAVGTRNQVAALRSRGREVRVFHAFGGQPDALVPGAAPKDVSGLVFEADLGSEAIGRDVYVEYGNPDATPEEIEAGDGKHVGTLSDAVARITAFIAFALQRLPEPDLVPDYPVPQPSAVFGHFWSEALQSRRGYTVAIPPGYDAPENADARYPVLFFLHGLGQDAADLAPASLATGALMSLGLVPKALLVFPDGGCCYVHTPTGQRECACRDAPGGVKLCADPTCKGPQAACEEREIPNGELARECHKGSLYTDMVTNRWGEPRDDLGYATSVIELVEHIDEVFRTRSGAAAAGAP